MKTLGRPPAPQGQSQRRPRALLLSETGATHAHLVGINGGNKAASLRNEGRRFRLGSSRVRYAQVLAFKTDASLANLEQAQVTHRLSEVVRYRFVVPQYVTAFGQSLRVVGSLPELGNWNPQLAPTMSWNDGHQWSLECALPQQSFEFKIIVCDSQVVRWEGGSNRVVQADDEEEGLPVEIVVWLTCNFNATASTQLQLALPRASIQDAYETGKATLEFLRRRKSKLGHDTEQVVGEDDRRRQALELARLSEAVVEQSSTVQELGGMLGHDDKGQGKARTKGAAAPSASSRSGTDGAAVLDDDNELLLLAIDSVRVPRALRRISFVQSWPADPALLTAGGAASANGASLAADGVIQAPLPSPFLRGELDSRAEELMSAAQELLQELKERPDEQMEAAARAASEWASLAQEAGHVAGALEALNGNEAAPHTTQLQMRGLASVGSALAGGVGATDKAPESGKPTAAAVANGVVPANGPVPAAVVAAGRVGAETNGTAAPLSHPAADATDDVPVDAPSAAKAPVSIKVDPATVMAAEVVSQGNPASDNGTRPLQTADWGIHPLQRLAASAKDTLSTPVARPLARKASPQRSDTALEEARPANNAVPANAVLVGARQAAEPSEAQPAALQKLAPELQAQSPCPPSPRPPSPPSSSRLFASGQERLGSQGGRLARLLSSMSTFVKNIFL